MKKKISENLSGLLREIPSVSEFIISEEGMLLSKEFGEGMVKLELRYLLQDIRKEIMNGGISRLPSLSELASILKNRLVRTAKPAGRKAINATGIILHTGLGRAPLSEGALEALKEMKGYSILQTDPDTGQRSRRDEKIEKMLMELTGCEAATVVNNNAAATMLVLNTLAAGKEAIISRGQLIEIGGAFRMPDVMAASGAILKEVGTTNITHLRDYENAITENTGAIIHVHTSNYRIRGFSGTPGIKELCELGRKKNIPVIDDLGSGAIVDLSEFGIEAEPMVKHSIAAGSSIACFSADKLISGPQAGIICGARSFIEKIRENPFYRMFRVCKLTLAALEATLVYFVNGTYREHIPFYRMLAKTPGELEASALRLIELLAPLPGDTLSIRDDISYVGSGSIPDQGLRTKVVRLETRKLKKPFEPEEFSRMLRLGLPSIFARVHEDGVHFDVRTLMEGELELLAGGILKLAL